MCWFIGYFETKLKAPFRPEQRDSFDVVNRPEVFPSGLEFIKCTVGGREVYSVEHGQCACDLFGFNKPGLKQPSRRAREAAERRKILRDFIAERMTLPAIEPRLLFYWQTGSEEIPLPDKAEPWFIHQFEELFQQARPGLFRLTPPLRE